jgi:Flp pilus assembly protein TadD
MTEYRRALELDDKLSPACNNLAWMLATHPDPQVRNGSEAIELAGRACRLTNNEQPYYLGTLAAAYAEAGRFSDAIATAEKARDLARKAGLENVARRNEQLLELYRAGRPYHEPADTN